MGKMTITVELALLLCMAALCHADDGRCAGKENGWILEIGCWGYIYCYYGEAVLYECPPNTVYDRDTTSCVLPETSTSGCGTAANCTGRPDGRYADPPCITFYLCLNNTNKGRYYCPAKLIFNNVTESCDWIFNVLPPCGTKRTN
ncbi:hypothetical protein Btru_076044 [Bulinus truncatus]|nr:hypothetical protein Btru_076044 [Bulinus truncatus]